MGPERDHGTESSDVGDKGGKDQTTEGTSGGSQSGQGSSHGETTISGDHGTIYDSNDDKK